MADGRVGPLAPSRLLWVEGKDDDAVVQSLCRAHGVPHHFRVQEKGGVERLLSGASIEIRAGNLDAFGLVVDGNGDPRSRWREIRTILADHGFVDLPGDAPAEGLLLRRSELLPRLGVWIMPDNHSPGALEDFVARLVPDGDPLWPRAGDAVDAILPEHRRFPPGRRAKAHMHTWLAWQAQPGSPMGQAIGKGDLDANAPAARAFVGWLRRLMVEDAG